MASETSLNQLVKGAPTSNVTTQPPTPLPSLTAATNKYTPSPDLSALPSSPPTIYLNLLILESSLRSQYLHLISRRRLNTFFLLVLAGWNFATTYLLFLKPREDGSGFGGSVYWPFEMLEKLAFMGGVATALLVWGTGQFERGVRWPRRWLSTTNRGLRPFNLRVVIIRRRWYREWLGHLSFLIPVGLFSDEEAAGFSDWHHVEHENAIVIEEDLAKGGDYIMLLLLPKSFSPEFRENWEEYRSEYWERENERRAGLRRKVKIQRRNKARENGGWKWYTGAWRVMPRHRPQAKRHQDLEKHAAHPHSHHHQQNQHSRTHSHTRNSSVVAGTLSEKDALLLKQSRRRSLRRDSSAGSGGDRDRDRDRQHSRQSSRSSTPVAPGDFDGISEEQQYTTSNGRSERVRRGSSVSSTASVRRKTRASGLGPLTSVGSSEERPRRKKESDRSKEERPTTPPEDGGVGGGGVGGGGDDGPWGGGGGGGNGNGNGTAKGKVKVKREREESVGLSGVA